MQEADLPEVVALEEQCGLSPWSLSSYRQELNNPRAILLVVVVGGAGVMPNAGGQIAGLLAGRVVVDEFEVHNLAVVSDRRRQGIGSTLLSAGLRAAHEQGVIRAVLEVRAANSAAVTLYRQYGFASVGRRSGYYQDPPDDALVMVCEGEAWGANPTGAPPSAES